MADAAHIEESIKKNDVKPIFADGFLTSFRIKARNTKGASAKPEDVTPIGGLIELIFVDESKQQALGRFVLDRVTTEELAKTLIDTIKKFDDVMGKGGLSKILPKNQPKQSDPSYR